MVLPQVLVVEDEPALRLLLADELDAAGVSTTEAASGGEALSVLAANPGIRLVITDLRMPGPINGRDLVRTIRMKYPSVKVLILSAFAPDPELASLVSGSFVKPVEFDVLVQGARLFLEE